MKNYFVNLLRSLGDNSIRMSMRLLSTRDRRLVYFVIAVTIFFGLMDLVGVMLIGAIGSLSVTGVSSGQTGNRVSRLLQSLNIETYSLQTQVGIL